MNKYQLPLSIDEANLVLDAIFKAAGGDLERFQLPANKMKRDLWVRLSRMVKDENNFRNRAEMAVWGRD